MAKTSTKNLLMAAIIDGFITVALHAGFNILVPIHFLFIHVSSRIAAQLLLISSLGMELGVENTVRSGFGRSALDMPQQLKGNDLILRSSDQ